MTLASMERPSSVLEAASLFGPFDGRVWMNTAHQGPLSAPAVRAAGEAAELKASPHRLAEEAFTEVPERLRRRWAELVGADGDDVVLGDSTSHGLHLVANGLRWRPGDEVLILTGDYPATVLPWQRLGGRGVRSRALHPAGELLTPEELAGAVTDRTRVVALTWVDSFTGRTLDLHALGAVCRQAGVLLVVNASQALGARPLDVASTPVDAVVSCGYKWLCGPYGTGFTWLRPQLREQLEPQQAYWLAMQAGRGLDRMRETELRHDLGVHAFDRFCPADFGDSLPMTAALDVVLGAGVEAIAAHDQALVDRLLARLDPERYELISPPDGPARSTLVVLRVRTGDTQRRQHALTAAGVDTAYREGALRVSLHLFNTGQQIDQLVQLLHDDRSSTTS